MKGPLFPPPVNKRLARELLERAPVFRGNPIIARFLDREVVDFERLVNIGIWSGGERRVVEAAAAIAGDPINGSPLMIDRDDLKYGLDAANYAAVSEVLAKLE
jgi:hypothetical protein